MIIERENEQKQLEQLYESEYSEFVAKYGRRRVGKTFLVRETFNYRFAFQHTGVQGIGEVTKRWYYISAEKYFDEKISPLFFVGKIFRVIFVQ